MPQINEDNVNQAIYDYAWERHGEILERYMDEWEDEFPEKEEDHPPGLAYKDLFSWIMFEKELPGTGRTLAELFAEDTPGLSEEMKDNLYRMREVIRSEFEVIEKDGSFLNLEDTASEKIYNVKMHEELPISPKTVVRGRIHPFDDHYRFVGIFFVTNPIPTFEIDTLMRTYEDSKLEELEDITLRDSTALRTVLNKYPARWIDHMCKHFGIEARLKKEKVEMIVEKLVNDMPRIISTIPEKSKEVLALCIDNGGVVKYGTLRDYDDDFTLFWKKERPVSTIGLLRMRALLLVGKMSIGERRYRVAYVPNEIRDGLRQILPRKIATLDDF